jgi:uncharacterized protein Usg
MPDYPQILQEFNWGFDDFIPDLYKTHKFLNHWRTNIDAVIADVLISIADTHANTWRSVDEILNTN